MKIGLGLSLTGQSRRADQIITAVIRPALGVLVDGDAIEDALSADIGEVSNYASTAGSITSVTVTATVNGNPADLTDTVSFEDAVVVTVTVQDDASNERVFTLSRAVTALVPDAFTAPDWDVVNDDGTISVNIITLPNDGGAPITDIEYRVNEGAAISLGENTTGSYEITADVDDDVQIRAVNAIGPGDWSDTKVVEVPTGVQATGGIETVIEQEGEFYRVHTFLESGDLTVTQGGEVEYLVVAGGGGGGPRQGGGGGAGGLLQNVISISTGVEAVTVGLGGAGSNDISINGENGQNSVFSTVETIGGGGGGAFQIAGSSGGSGGGGGRREGALGGSGTTNQGNDGGASREGTTGGAGGGGGGADEAGGNADVDFTGKGGDGLSSSISGTTTFYAGGGSGGSRTGALSVRSEIADAGLGGGGKGSQDSDGENGQPSTGGGGGGAGDASTGGNGGSGIVIVRYPITEAEYNAEAA